MSKTLLIVDDNDERRQRLASTLGNPNHRLMQATSSDEALAVMTENRPDLIVLDLMIPGRINGLQLCHHIKTHPAYRTVKVILLTPQGQRTPPSESAKVKADAYLVKPVSPTELRNQIKQLLNESVTNDAAPTKNHAAQPKKDASLDFVFPPRPITLVKIQQELNKDNPDSYQVAQYVAADISLSAELLKTVNSPFYGLRNKVCSVTDAVNLIGLTRTLHLATAASVRSSVPLPVGMEYFWDDVTKVAQMGATIAKHLAMDVNLAYLMGLFHDAAVPLMAAKYPDYLGRFLGFHGEEQEIHEAEQTRYQMNHAMLGGLMARAWYLPPQLIDAIRLHHSHEVFALGLNNDVLNLISVHLIADHIADHLKGDMDVHYPKLEQQVRRHLNLSAASDYQHVIDRALDSINEE